MVSSEPGRDVHQPRNSPTEKVRHIRFVPRATPGETGLLRLLDPVPAEAVETSSGELAIWTSEGAANDSPVGNDEKVRWVAEVQGAGTPLPFVITIHGAQVIWSGSRAAIVAAPDRVESLLSALVDFIYHECELRKIEQSIGADWPLLESDTPLAYEVNATQTQCFADLGRRMEETLKRRIRLARIQPRLTQTRPHLTPVGNQLFERLCERSQTESRLESLTAQLEVFVRIYEMSSQRISDFKHARQGQVLEWIIILLLAAEALLLLLDLFWATGG